MHYPCGENKGADQLRGYREADLRLCFRICKKPVFSRRGSIGFILFSRIDCSFFFVLVEFLVLMTNLWLIKNILWVMYLLQLFSKGCQQVRQSNKCQGPHFLPIL